MPPAAAAVATNEILTQSPRAAPPVCIHGVRVHQGFKKQANRRVTGGWTGGFELYIRVMIVKGINAVVVDGKNVKVLDPAKLRSKIMPAGLAKDGALPPRLQGPTAHAHWFMHWVQKLTVRFACRPRIAKVC